MIVSVPGNSIEITPPHMHMHVDSLFSAGISPIRTVGEPGSQGETVAGIQGIGVITPILAAVAAATTGLAMEEHVANGKMFKSGM